MDGCAQRGARGGLGRFRRCGTGRATTGPATFRLRAGIGAVLVALPLVLAACQYRLTPQGAPYRVDTYAQTVLTYAPPTTGANNREMTWGATPVQGDATECATWLYGQGIAQNGLAFDIHSTPQRTTAIVLERNVWMAGFWDFVGIDFDSTAPTGFTVIPDSGVNLSSYLGEVPAPTYPLRVCARIVGTSLQFEVCKGTELGTPNPPPFGTLGQGGTISLAGLADATPGMTGVYEAHVPPGTLSVVDNVTLDGAPYTP